MRGYHLKYKGIVFDLDGTLIHTEVNFRDMKAEMIKVLEEKGLPKNFATPDLTSVVILEEAEKYWKNQLRSEAEKQMLRDEMTVIMDTAEMKAIETLKIIPGIPETIKILKNRGYKIAILTRSNHAYAVEAVKKMKIETEIDVILGRGDTSQPKPYAEAMIEAAKALKMEINEVFMVGDHHIDSTCAINAGCFFIGVGSGPRLDRAFEINRPEVILPSVADLPDYLEKNSL
ncbi:HAD family hydrolase [Candidatus Bathyarchaeota archaeon]|nr:HAD family hydrolase [Candidatus Bathyarchaeota archaeon]